MYTSASIRACTGVKRSFGNATMLGNTKQILDSVPPDLWGVKELRQIEVRVKPNQPDNWRSDCGQGKAQPDRVE